MALLFVEGFRWTNTATDLDDGDKWTGIGTGDTIGTPGPVTGTNYYRAANNGIAPTSNLHRPTGITTPTDKIIVGFRFRTDSVEIPERVMLISQGSTVRGGLWIVAGLSLRWVYGDNAGNTVLTTTGSISQDNWHYIEVEITAATTATGNVRIAIDGDIEDAGGSVQTFDAADTSNTVAFISESADSGNHDFMDIYIADDNAGNITAPVGDVQVVTASPGGDDAVAWDETVPDPPTTHYDSVDELNTPIAVLASDTKYNQTVGTGKTDQFTITFPDLSLNSGDTIYGAQVCAVMGDVDTAAPDVIIGIEESGGAEGASAGNSLPDGSYEVFFHMVEDNPVGGTPDWTKTTADAMKLFLRTV